MSRILGSARQRAPTEPRFNPYDVSPLAIDMPAHIGKINQKRLRQDRLAKFQRELVKRDYAGALLSNPMNIRYATVRGTWRFGPCMHPAGRWAVLHHTALLDELVTGRRLQPASLPLAGTVAYHDPCYLARYNGETAAPRRLLDAVIPNRVEMVRHGMRAMCCGGGGGSPVSDVPGEHRIADLRMAQAREAGATTLAVACPGCTAMLEGVTWPRPEVRDIAELLLEGVEAADDPATPRSARRPDPASAAGIRPPALRAGSRRGPRRPGLTMSVQETAESDIAFAAIVHLGQTVPRKYLRSVLVSSDMLDCKTADGDYPLVNGHVIAPDTPGLGITPRMDVLGAPVASYS